MNRNEILEGRQRWERSAPRRRTPSATARTIACSLGLFARAVAELRTRTAPAGDERVIALTPRQVNQRMQDLARVAGIHQVNISSHSGRRGLGGPPRARARLGSVLPLVDVTGHYRTLGRSLRSKGTNAGPRLPVVSFWTRFMACCTRSVRTEAGGGPATTSRPGAPRLARSRRRAASTLARSTTTHAPLVRRVPGPFSSGFGLRESARSRPRSCRLAGAPRRCVGTTRPSVVRGAVRACLVPGMDPARFL